MGIGSTELMIILLIVVVLFGGSRFAQIGAGLGKGIREFKKAMTGEEEKSADKDSEKKNGVS